MPEVQKSCCHVATPSNAICMKQMKYTPLKYAQKKVGFWQVSVLPQTFVTLVSTTKYFEGAKDGNKVPQGTSVSHWMAIYLKGQWEIKVTTSNFCISHCVFRVHLLSVLNKQYR